MLPVRHRVSLLDAHAHLVRVTSTFSAPQGSSLPEPLIVAMPVWTPGSYLVREFSRCVERFSAGEHPAHKVRKNAWAVAHGGRGEVTIEYDLYANDLSVRTNHADATHLFVHGAGTFMFAEHAPQTGAEVTVELPDGWRAATALPAVGGGPTPRDATRGASAHGASAREATFAARDFDHLVDCPIHCGPDDVRAFDVLGKPHRFVVHGHAPAARWDELIRDTTRIIEAEAELLGGLPYDEYTFFWLLTPRARGGLEHADCCALSLPPSSFEDRHGVLDVLSLVAHEFLHLWNVKRIRPAALTPYRYEQEGYTRLLWWFEGATSYFDWRVLRLASLCSVDEYLDHLGDAIARLEDTPGRARQSAAEASFDAWIKLYRADENTVNSTVSYYLKGELVCALLDVELRARTTGERGLDQVLQALWRSYGAEGCAVPEDALPAVFAEVAGCSMDDVLEPWVHGRQELPFDDTLRKVGLTVRREPGKRRGALGVRLRTTEGRAIVSSVLRHRPAHAAGLDAGDELVAIGGRRVEGGRVEPALAGLEPHATVELDVARDGVMRRVRLTLDAPPAERVVLRLAADATAAQRALLTGWLRGLPSKGTP